MMCSVRPIRELEIAADGRFPPNSAMAKNKFLAPTMAGIEYRHAAVGFFPLLTDYPA
jgi:hypothetical protein